jgi:uncharacterized oxidoreductase
MTVTLPAESLYELLVKAYAGYGAPAGTADQVARHLVEASLTGHDSHGALRAPWYMEKIQAGELDPAAVPTVVQETGGTAIIDGHWGFGQPASNAAIRLCIDKARQSGLACVTVRNANHMGRVGYYTAQAAAAGMVGMGCVNLHGASPCVAPFGGIDRKLPTNPISVAYPTDRSPDFLMDMTTSVVAEGKLQLRRNKGVPADNDWIIDHDGAATTDPWDFYREPFGSLLPLGGVVAHKGFALSMAVEGLAGGLSGAPCTNADEGRHGNACWYMAIRVDAFVPLDTYRRNVGRLIDYVKESRKDPAGSGEILYPGEPEHRIRQARLISGVSLDDHTWDWLTRQCAEVGVRYDGPILPNAA